MGKGKTNEGVKTGAVGKERSQFRRLLAENPNFFGTAPWSGRKAVMQIAACSRYEKISWLGFYPHLDMLAAVVTLDQPAGYRGMSARGGSWEYVRFFVDWDGDGEYNDPGENVGIAAVHVDDSPHPPAGRPLTYALRLKIPPRPRVGRMPPLLKVRAILSWENPPPDGEPDFPVVWGHVFETWIQVRPDPFLPRVQDFPQNRHGSPAVSAFQPLGEAGEARALTQPELARLYRNGEVPCHRYNFAALHELAQRLKHTPSALPLLRQDPRFVELEGSVAALLKAKPSIRYEELRCVGLHPELEQLIALLTVKLPKGYNGDLNTAGSMEYVAFWLQPDGGGSRNSWLYLGTAAIRVHDIRPMPVGGLQYAVYLPVALSTFQREGCAGRPLRIRAVLSWNVRPDPAAPDHLPTWGNRIETVVRMMPGEGVAAGERRPLLRAVGTMPVSSIAGNPQTIQGSVLGEGYANGVSMDRGFIAVESPFGGEVAISGRITNPPDKPSPADRLRYKVQYKKNGGAWKDIVDGFRILLRVNGEPAGFVQQTADREGYFRYQADDPASASPPVVEVEDDLLALWHTPAAEGDGLYRLRILLHAPGTIPAAGVPADHLASQEVRVMIDNTPPSAALALTTGEVALNAVLAGPAGRFTARDPHIWSYTLSMLPGSGEPSPGVAAGLGRYPVMSAPGPADSTFSLTGSDQVPGRDGFLRLQVVDRAIVDNRFPGNRSDIETRLGPPEKG